MKSKIIVMLIFMLLMATLVLPLVSSIDEDGVAHLVSKSNSENECGCFSQQKHGLGYIPLTEWVEGIPLPEQTGQLPNSLDWRLHNYNNVTGDWTTSAKDQGSCGSCWIFAAMGALESAINIAYNNPNLDHDLSEQYILSCYSNGWGCNGGHPYSAFNYLKNNQGGAIPETCFPYQANHNIPCSDKCTDWMDQLIKTVTDYQHYSSVSALQMKAQLANGPICVSMKVYDNFWRPQYYPPGSVWDANGVYIGPAGPYIESHSVVIVGYNDNPGYWICKNSWGTSWGPPGMDGFFGMPYGMCDIESEMDFVTFLPGVAPDKPSKPSGPTSGKILIPHTYSTSTIDSDGDKVYYKFDWDDGTSGNWLGPFTSGQTISIPHIWVEEGSYQIKVKAKDINGRESPWSDPLPVTMPRNRAATNHFSNFLLNHPKLLQIFQLILNL